MPPVICIENADCTDAREAIVERTCRAAAPLLSAWFDEPVLRASLAMDVERDLAAGGTADRRDQNETATGSHRQVESIRLVRLDGREPRWIVAQLQRGDRPESAAWITIKHRSFDLATHADIAEARHAAHEAFAEETGARVLVSRFATEADPIPDRLAVQTHVVAGLIREIRLPNGASRTSSNLRLVAPDSMNFYDAYEAWYREFWNKRPELTAQVPIESAEDLEACMADDGLRLVHVQGQLGGLIAAKRIREFGLKGWRICEKVIAPAFWGRGLSAAATVAFAHALPHEDDDAIWGTIVPGNHASWRSATMIGRRVIGTVYWLDRDEPVSP